MLKNRITLTEFNYFMLMEIFFSDGIILLLTELFYVNFML